MGRVVIRGFIIVLSLVPLACLESGTPSSGFLLCPQSEGEGLVPAGWYAVDAFPGLIAQRMAPSGTSGSKIHLTGVRVYMSSNGVTAATMEIRHKTTASIDTDPVIATSVLTSGLGSSSYTSTLQYSFPSGVPLEVGESYYVVIYTTGAGFQISGGDNFMTGTISIKAGAGSWNHLSTSYGDLPNRYTYSGCSN